MGRPFLRFQFQFDAERFGAAGRRKPAGLLRVSRARPRKPRDESLYDPSPQNRALRNARPGTREAPERCPGGPNSYDLLWALGPGTPPLRIRGGVFLWAPRVHTAPRLQS